MNTTLTATSDQPPQDPAVTYRTRYRALMDHTIAALRQSLRLTGRN